jgi:ubiquinol-cytochrome c reductase cytochrome b subunit
VARPSARRLLAALDKRLGAARFTREALNKVFPDHWSFMLGEVAAYAFVVLVATGVYLTLFFDPSTRQVTYQGVYGPLRGVPMSAAYRSTVALSYDVNAGLLMRQVHHWAALVFIAALVAHAARIFFTGAFRAPRELNWIVGLTMALLAVGNGFTGYSLPDDLLSGTGLRIAWSVLVSIPGAGPWLGFTIFGGEFPGSAIIGRLFVIHILIVPVALAGLLGAHLAMVWRQTHTQFRATGADEGHIVGSRLWPTYALRSVALLAAVAAVLAALGGLAQINPIWLFGPYQPAAATTAAQPDWYVGWLEGALRLMPTLRLHPFGYRMPEVIVPGVVLPLVVFGLLYTWPLLERWVTGDRGLHHMVDRPRDRPVRTAIGVGGLTFGAVLTLAGSQDLVAEWLNAPVATVTMVLRVAVIVAPPAAALVAWRVCHELAEAEPLAEFAAGGPPPVGPNEPRHGPPTAPEAPVPAAAAAAAPAPATAPAGGEGRASAGRAVLGGLLAAGLAAYQALRRRSRDRS